MDTLTVVSRRSALKGFAAVAVVAPLPVLASSTGLEAVLAAYDEAYAAFEVAGDELDQKQRDWRATVRTAYVPVLMATDGSIKAAAEFTPHGDAADVVARIERAHAKELAVYQEDRILNGSPALLSEVRALLDRSKVECMAVLQDVLAHRAKASSIIGIDRAEADYEAASEALNAAADDVLRYVPTSSTERQTKADWLLTLFKQQGDMLDPRQVEALAQAIRGEA